MAGLGGARVKGPAAPMRELFYSLGLWGVLGAFFFFFNSFLREKKKIKTSKLIFLVTEKLI